INELLPTMSDDMGFMKGRRMEDGVHTLHASLHIRAVDDRPDITGKAGIDNVEANDFMLCILQRANQRLAKMSGAACNQNSHIIPSLLSEKNRVVEILLLWRALQRGKFFLLQGRI